MKLEKQSSSPPKWLLWAAPVALFIVAAKLLNESPPTNFAQTSPEHQDGALRTRYYRASWTQVVEAAQEALALQSTYGRHWKMGQNSVSGTKPSEHLVEVLRAHVPVFVFTDDFKVTLHEEGDGRVRVDCRSAARLGKGDFGENRRHILQFLATLDEKIGN